MEMLAIDDLWVSIEDREVLKGINMTIPAGETHILFGRNGSGKSTLLMALMGFERYRVERGRSFFEVKTSPSCPPMSGPGWGWVWPFNGRPPFAESRPEIFSGPALAAGWTTRPWPRPIISPIFWTGR